MVVKEAELLFQAGAQVPVIKQSDDGWLVTLEGTHQLNPILDSSSPAFF
jgi:hypothetical protein